MHSSSLYTFPLFILLLLYPPPQHICKWELDIFYSFFIINNSFYIIYYIRIDNQVIKKKFLIKPSHYLLNILNFSSPSKTLYSALVSLLNISLFSLMNFLILPINMIFYASPNFLFYNKKRKIFLFF